MRNGLIAQLVFRVSKQENLLGEPSLHAHSGTLKENFNVRQSLQISISSLKRRKTYEDALKLLEAGDGSPQPKS